VELDTDGLGALVDRGAAVRVFVKVVAPQDLLDDLGELVDRRHIRHEHDLAGVSQPDDVLLDPEPVELLLVRVPIRPDPLEHTRAVQEGVGHERNTCLAQPYVSALEVADEVGLIGRGRRASGGAWRAQ